MPFRQNRRTFNRRMLAGSIASLALGGCASARGDGTTTGGVSSTATGTPPLGLKEGQRAPDFRLTTIDGKTIGSAELLAQKRPYVRFFFATW